MMPAAATLLWLLLTLVLLASAQLAPSRQTYRTAAFVSVVVTLTIAYSLVWSTAATTMERWTSGLNFDNLGKLLLPPLWSILGITIIVALFTGAPKLFPALGAFMATVVTASLLSANALFLVAMLQVAVVVTLLGLFLGLDPHGPDAVLRLATSLKYLTLSVISGACLVVALLLISFYTLNHDRVELPRIIASLMVVGFGLAVAAIPFYFHLPDLF
ncbi:MAG: hypothetical protein KGJ86_16915, partial [Chloroflexota bacterium]|nr:hypothetical protein [Chloroflexota bacterium]